MDSPYIQYIEHSYLDIDKWDRCVSQALNGPVYAHSFYLDTMAKNWDALVLNDYEAVMPLPRRKKFGFHYLFQPFLTPVLGVIGKDINHHLVRSFLLAIPARFSLWDLSLNHNSMINDPSYPSFKRANYILKLDRPYESISSNYHNNIARNISKSKKEGCELRKNIPVDEIIAICRKEYPKFTRTEAGAFDSLKKIFLHYHMQNKAITYGVYANGKLLSGCAFLFTGERAYYWLAGNEPESKKLGSSPLLIDAFIKDHSDKKIILDFEGSDQEGIAAFYKKFGATLEEFQTIYLNKLPFPLHLLKPLPEHYKKIRPQPQPLSKGAGS